MTATALTGPAECSLSPAERLGDPCWGKLGFCDERRRHDQVFGKRSLFICQSGSAPLSGCDKRVFTRGECHRGCENQHANDNDRTDCVFLLLPQLQRSTEAHEPLNESTVASLHWLTTTHFELCFLCTSSATLKVGQLVFGFTIKSVSSSDCKNHIG